MRRILSVIFAATIVFFIGSQAQAAIVDLTVTGSSGIANNAVFIQGWPGDVSGSGVFDPFVRIQKNESEQGYNSDGTLVFDAKSGIFTHSISLNSVSTVLYNNIIYREFLLDIGQNNDLLSLDKVQIYLNSTDNAVTGTNLANLGTLIYDLDAGGDNWIKFNHSDSGNGNADMTMLVPNSIFGGANPYVYLYSKFGENLSTNDGFEEWGVRKDATFAATPEPLSWSLVGLVRFALVVFKKRKN